MRDVSFSADGNRLIAAGSDNKARIYLMDGALMEYFTHEGPVVAALLHPDGKQIVTASADKSAKAWTSSLVWRATHSGPVRQAMFAPKGDVVLSASDDKTLKVWNAVDGKALKSIVAHEGAIV